MSSVHLALHPFHHNPGRTCSHTDRPCNSDWGISWIKGPLWSQGTFVSSDRFHRASMVTGNWAWKEDFIQWIDLEKETEREGNVGAIVLNGPLCGNSPRTFFWWTLPLQVCSVQWVLLGVLLAHYFDLDSLRLSYKKHLKTYFISTPLCGKTKAHLPIHFSLYKVKGTFRLERLELIWGVTVFNQHKSLPFWSGWPLPAFQLDLKHIGPTLVENWCW